jgi:hypothetical protein
MATLSNTEWFNSFQSTSEKVNEIVEYRRYLIRFIPKPAIGATVAQIEEASAKVGFHVGDNDMYYSGNVIAFDLGLGASA